MSAQITPPPTRAHDDSPEKRRGRGQRIRWARELVEPNRLVFARKLGLDVTTIRNIEIGKTNPGMPLLHKICHSLRISLDYIVEGSLSGVDPELAILLVQEHPELAPHRSPALRPHNPGTEPQTNTFSSLPGAFYPQR